MNPRSREMLARFQPLIALAVMTILGVLLFFLALRNFHRMMVREKGRINVVLVGEELGI